MVLDKEFIDSYRSLPVPMDALGQFTYLRTYARPGETWVDTCARVIRGMYWLQEQAALSFDMETAERSAREAYDMLFNLKWSPPGRGLWIMGTPFIQERLETAALQNCAFISSGPITTERGDFFRWLMEMSMLGVGVGFDTLGANQVQVRGPLISSRTYHIEDTRQSWAASVEALVNCYLDGSYNIEFDYDTIRPAGSPIVSFGGIASGPEPLRSLHLKVRTLLQSRIGAKLTSRDIVDICNMIGECVIAGNVRRSAEIALGSQADSEFVRLKDFAYVGETRPWSWVSNNSVTLPNGAGVSAETVARTYNNGEPGYFWIDNARSFGRMNGVLDDSDAEAVGVNPCAEQILHHRELCTLSEIYLPRISTRNEFARAVKYAYLYAKSVTLGSEYIDDAQSREVMLKNRRIGLSLTGVAQFVAQHDTDTLIDWMEYGYKLSEDYDHFYSDWLNVPLSIRRTSIKPSGTVSLLAGVTPGIHYPTARTYIRRINVAANSALVERLVRAGYNIEVSKYSENTLVVEFPVSLGADVPTQREVSMMDQLRLATIAAEHWADNSVSVTIMFDKDRETVEDLQRAIEFASTRLKAVSFLPISDSGYEQMPYEEISLEKYGQLVEGIQPLDLTNIESHELLDAFCDGEACILPDAQQ